MNNYEHEIKEINNRKLKYFLYNDYFHDSVITKMTILGDGKEVFLEMSCEREWPEHDWKKYVEDENYKYTLKFLDCKYVECERKYLGTYSEFINGRFKNSSKLKEFTKHTRGKHYHFRIQLADGFIDLIFKDFDIEKIVGDINIPNRISTNFYFDEVKLRFNHENIEEIRRNRHLWC